jgi:hypothetical protein
LQTKAGVTLDHEAAKNEYTVTVGVTDANVVETGETNSQPEFASATATRSITKMPLATQTARLMLQSRSPSTSPMSQKIPVVVDNKPVAQ